jgi:hypothetical protein
VPIAAEVPAALQAYLAQRAARLGAPSPTAPPVDPARPLIDAMLRLVSASSHQSEAGGRAVRTALRRAFYSV